MSNSNQDCNDNDLFKGAITLAAGAALGIGGYKGHKKVGSLAKAKGVKTGEMYKTIGKNAVDNVGEIGSYIGKGGGDVLRGSKNAVTSGNVTKNVKGTGRALESRTSAIGDILVNGSEINPSSKGGNIRQKTNARRKKAEASKKKVDNKSNKSTDSEVTIDDNFEPVDFGDIQITYDT